VDTETVDRQFSALQGQGQQTAELIQRLADKLSAAVAAGDPNAREWGLDLKEIALAIRDEQITTTELLQSIRALVDTHVAATPPAAQPYYAPATHYARSAQNRASYQPPSQPQYPQPARSSDGALLSFLGGAFGQAIVAGIGFGIGDDIVDNMFDSF